MESTAAPPLLLLHGFTGAGDAWGTPLLCALAARARVVALDLPGHGASEVPSGAPLTVPGVAGMVAGVLERLGLPPAVWVGYSMGGRVAIAAAVNHPGQVTGLVLESTSPGLESAAARARRRAEDEEGARELEEGGLVPFVDRWLALPLFRGLRDLPTGEREAERNRRLRNSPRALAAVLRGMGTGSQPWYGDHLDRLRIPTLVLAGGADGKYVSEARRMAARLPLSTLVEVPGVGHVVHREAPGPWLAAVLAFLVRRFPTGPSSPPPAGDPHNQAGSDGGADR